MYFRSEKFLRVDVNEVNENTIHYLQDWLNLSFQGFLKYSLEHNCFYISCNQYQKHNLLFRSGEISIFYSYVYKVFRF